MEESVHKMSSRSTSFPLLLSTPSFIIISLLAMTLFLLSLLFIPLSSSSSNQSDVYSFLHERYHRDQIPLLIVPYFYRIHLKLFVPFEPSINFGSRNFTFDGNVNMSLIVRKSTDRILLHSKGLSIESIILLDEFGLRIPVVFGLSPSLQILDINCTNKLEVDRSYYLKIRYKGKIAHDGQSHGFYATSHKENGTLRYAVATHLQPNMARTVFPSLDVPLAKAVFETIVTHPKGVIAVSNGKEINSSVHIEDGREWIESRFEETLKMSTYIFALCVADYPYRETNHGSVRIRLYIEPSKLGDIDNAVSAVPRLLAYYEDFFGIPYPLPKLDIFAVPSMQVAAMENWGLIICRQKHTIFNPNISQDITASYVVLAHEISHQWFGNLVTMKWWTSLWMNEGFATLMGQIGSEQMNNEDIRVYEMRGVDLTISLRKDEAPKVFPVSVRVDKPTDPMVFFSPITYSKAHMILRMIRHVVSEPIFKQGVNRFLRQYEYSNADPEDLIRTFVEVHDENDANTLTGDNFTLGQVIETWIYQEGHPIVTLHSIDNSSNRFIVRQKTYKNYARLSLAEEERLWTIPFFLHNESGDSYIHWMTQRETEITIGNDLILDSDVQVFIRIRYPPNHYMTIIDNLKRNSSIFSQSAKSRLMDDAFTFAEKGDHSYQIPLLLVLAIVDEDVLTMKTFQAHLNLLQVRLSTFPDKYHLLQKYISRVLSPLFKNSKNFESESRKDGQMKEVILNELCENEYEGCLQFGWSHFISVRDTNNVSLTRQKLSILPRYIRTSIYMAGGKLGNQSDFDLLIRLFVTEEYSEEKDRIFKGMVENNKKHNMYRLFDELVEKVHLTGYELHNFLHGYLRRHAYKSNHYESYFAENRDRFQSSKYPLEIQRALYISYAKASTVENLGRLENVTQQFYLSSNESWFRDEWMRQKSRIDMAFNWTHSFAPTIFNTLSSLVSDST